MGALNLHIGLLPDKTTKYVVDTPGAFLANLISTSNTHKVYTHTHTRAGQNYLLDWRYIYTYLLTPTARDGFNFNSARASTRPCRKHSLADCYSARQL